MTSYWRLAGFSYLQYSSICARLLRRSLKPELREAALKREESGLKVTRWEQGKPTADTKIIGK